MKVFYGLMAALMIGFGAGAYATQGVSDTRIEQATQSNLQDAINDAKIAKKMKGTPHND